MDEGKGTTRVVYIATFVSPHPPLRVESTGGWLSSATVDAHPLVVREEGLRRRKRRRCIYIYIYGASVDGRLLIRVDRRINIMAGVGGHCSRA